MKYISYGIAIGDVFFNTFLIRITALSFYAEYGKHTV